MYCSNIEQLVSGEINHESIMKSIKFVLLITDFKQPYLEEKLYVLCLFGCMNKIIICTSCIYFMDAPYDVYQTNFTNNPM